MSNRALDSLSSFQRMRRLALFVLLLIVAAGLLFCGPVLTDAGSYELYHELIEAVGIGLIGLAILGRLWSTLYIGGRKATEIVDRGPYSVTRNPLYVFSAIGAVGAGAQTGSIAVGLFFGFVTALAFHVVILREEAVLREAFGAPYTAYCSTVPRFFPRFSLYRDDEVVSVYPGRLYTTLFDGLVFFAAIPAFELIEWGQETGYLPVLLRLI